MGTIWWVTQWLLVFWGCLMAVVVALILGLRFILWFGARVFRVRPEPPVIDFSDHDR